MTKLTAQDLYDLREATGFVSGTDLQAAFTELVGEPSPKGKTPITVPAGHWLESAAKMDSVSDAIQKYEPELAGSLGAKITKWATK